MSQNIQHTTTEVVHEYPSLSKQTLAADLHIGDKLCFFNVLDPSHIYMCIAVRLIAGEVQVVDLETGAVFDFVKANTPVKILKHVKITYEK